MDSGLIAMTEPIWHRVANKREEKLLVEARDFAFAVCGRGSWSERHENAVNSYLKRNR